MHGQDPDPELSPGEQHLWSLLNYAPTPLLWFDMNTGLVLGTNVLFRALVAREGRDLNGTWIDEIVDREHMPKLMEYREQFRNGRSDPVACELRLIRGSGTFHAFVEIAPAPGPGSTTGWLIMHAKDSSSLRVAEQALESLNSILERLAVEWSETFDAVQMPVLVLDSELRVRRLNRAASLAAAAHFRDVIGLRVDAVRACEPWLTAAELAQATLSSGQPGSFEARDIHSGAVWEISTSLVTARDDLRERIVVTARDITTTYQLRKSLQRSEMLSLLGSLVAGVAHEVRNPLFGISATIDAFEVEYRNLGGLTDYLRTLRRDVRRLTLLMNELLDYGKPHALNLERTRLDLIVEEAIHLCEPLSQERRIPIEFRAAPSLPLVLADEERMLTVFKNLIENALVLSQPDSHVSIGTAYGNEDGQLWVLCSIADRGPGFSDEALQHLFEPFYTRRPGGTGLGLALVQQIVADHRGGVVARNRNGGGAVFEVRLPAAADGIA